MAPEEPLRPQPSSTHSSQSSVPGINRDDDAFTTYLREHPDNNVSVPELTMQMSRSQETLATGAGTEQRQEHGQTDDDVQENSSSLEVAPGSTSYDQSDPADSPVRTNGHHTNGTEVQREYAHIGQWSAEQAGPANTERNRTRHVEARGRRRRERRGERN